MTIHLSTIHVLHCVLGIVRIVVLDVAKAATHQRMETIGRKLDVLYFAVYAEDLNNVLLGDVACQSSDMDAWRSRFRRLFALSTHRVRVRTTVISWASNSILRLGTAIRWSATFISIAFWAHTTIARFRAILAVFFLWVEFSCGASAFWSGLTALTTVTTAAWRWRRRWTEM